MQYTSDTEYSDDDGSEEEEDDISVCSGSTISAGGQSCSVSDLMSGRFDDAYLDGKHALLMAVRAKMLQAWQHTITS